MKQSIGEKIREAREERKLTREDLAKKLDISSSYVGHLENDSLVRISPRVVSIIKKVLHTRISQSAIDAHNEATRKWRRAWAKKQKSA